MTPNNIVNMSYIKGLDVIAITDHNTCGNAEAAIKAAGDNILVIPGMEIETSEEIHVISYFPDIEKEDFSVKSVDNLISILENLVISIRLKKTGLKVEDVEEILELKDVLK